MKHKRHSGYMPLLKLLFNTKTTKVKRHKVHEKIRTQSEIPAVFLCLLPN
jgi:hypothetical protein